MPESDLHWYVAHTRSCQEKKVAERLRSKGPLFGMVCECAEIQNRHRIVVRLGPLGSLLVTIDAADVEKV